jgi:hypothetical protein
MFAGRAAAGGVPIPAAVMIQPCVVPSSKLSTWPIMGVAKAAGVDRMASVAGRTRADHLVIFIADHLDHV